MAFIQGGLTQLRILNTVKGLRFSGRNRCHLHLPTWESWQLAPVKHRRALLGLVLVSRVTAVPRTLPGGFTVPSC